MGMWERGPLSGSLIRLSGGGGVSAIVCVFVLPRRL